MEKVVLPKVTAEDPSVERTMGVHSITCTAHVAHGVDPPGVGMDHHGPDSKGDQRHKRHRPDGDTVEGGGGADRNSPPYQPTDAQHPPWVQVRKRYRDGYNGVKALQVDFQNRPGPPLPGIPGP